jgi:YidC/Oxa1 family membrane protein insertase
MLIAMFFQQKLSTKMTAMAQTEEQKKQQHFMAIMMTAMFGFIFYSFPSGLVLYWLANTVLMTVYQVVFTKPPHTAEEPA